MVVLVVMVMVMVTVYLQSFFSVPGIFHDFR